MKGTSPTSATINAVDIKQDDKRWTVRITEGKKVEKGKFTTEEFANNFAAGQRVRLGLPDPAKAN
jgi:hypothetical protein